MRLATISVLIVLSNLALGQGRPAVSVSISTPTPAIQQGTPIRLNISVLNRSNHTVQIFGPADGKAEASNGVQVTNAEGQKLPWIGHRRGFSSRKMVAVEPGKSVDDFLTLTNDFDLTKPGQYTVVVRHEMFQPDATPPEKPGYFVESNSLTITVTD